MRKIPYHLKAASTEKTNTDTQLENLYHRGQEKIWDGRSILEEAIIEAEEQKISRSNIEDLNIDLADQKKRSLRSIFSLILWGEYAAWTISADLASKLDSFGAKMAATSQAHDEARHFYVIRDYLAHLGVEPNQLSKPSESVMLGVMNSNSLEKKILGMQLLVEPVALTLFQLVREAKIDPVLTKILEYFSRDEARHVSFGVIFLPQLLRKLSKTAAMDLWLYQARLLMAELDGLKHISQDLQSLGIDPKKAFAAGRKRQMDALEEMLEAVGSSTAVVPILEELIDLKDNGAKWGAKRLINLLKTASSRSKKDLFS